MQSTVNYLWHTDDLLGQGATASVYKARNKVGTPPRPALPRTREGGPQRALGLRRVWAGSSDLHCLRQGRGAGV